MPNFKVKRPAQKASHLKILNMSPKKLFSAFFLPLGDGRWGWLLLEYKILKSVLREDFNGGEQCPPIGLTIYKYTNYTWCFGSLSSTTRKRQKLSCNLLHPREYFRPLARLKHSEILKESNSWNRISDTTSTITKKVWPPSTCSQLSPQSEQECLENIHPC